MEYLKNYSIQSIPQSRMIRIQKEFVSKWVNIFRITSSNRIPNSVWSLGPLTLMMNVPVYWRSKAQRDVTLSSNETEYVSISKSLKNQMYLYFTSWYLVDLELLKLWEIPIKLFQCLWRKIFWRAQAHVTCFEEGTIKIEFVRSCINNSNILNEECKWWLKKYIWREVLRYRRKWHFIVLE
jgi:hypothetical protein